jgi:hypothetical protein
MRGYTIFLTHQIFIARSIKEDRMTRVCGTCEGGERCLEVFDVETEGKMPLQ